MSAFGMSDVELRDLKIELHKEEGISFTLCGVGGHDRHGHIERVIKSMQDSFVDSQYNNLPKGFHHNSGLGNTPLLRVLTPNMLRIGRVNQRSMEGPVKIPKS